MGNKDGAKTAQGTKVRFSGWLCIFIAKLIIPRDMVIVPKEPTSKMLDVEFYGDLGSGFNGWHKYLRADEYWFAKRSDAVDFGKRLYKAMVNSA